MIVSTRVMVICVTVTFIGTMYSLSQLHDVSTQMLKQALREETERKAPQAAAAAVYPSPVVEHVQATALATTSKTVAGATTTTLTATQAARKAFYYPHTELWGDVVKWGNNNKASSAEDCGDQCKAFAPLHPEDPSCNVFVYCGDDMCKQQKGECWLKHLVHAEASKPSRQGPDVGWTAGTLDVDMNANPAKGREKSEGDRRYHIVTSAQGVAVHWQCRIHYYWYKKQKAQCEMEGNCDMGGWTRLLHSGKADDLMDELPTMVVDPLPKSLVENNWYVVLNRPYAFVQWAERAKIPERFVLMAEPDHIMLRPIPNFMSGNTPASFPFFYIEPAKPDYKKIVEKFTGPMTKKQLEEIAPVGNSPTFMAFSDMKKVMPVWMNTSIAIFKDKDASKAWGWVQEMYGFCIAVWMCGITKVDLFLHLMSQPPWDTKLELSPGKPFYIIHYTYGMDYKLTGEFTPGKFGEWRFDKRSHSGSPLPRNMSAPPKGMQNDLVRTLINSFNEATAAIPCWDEYAKTGKVPKTCDEKPGGFLALEAATKQKGADS